MVFIRGMVITDIKIDSQRLWEAFWMCSQSYIHELHYSSVRGIAVSSIYDMSEKPFS